uniref:Galectin n=2 Tax=Meloidogyne TaxID=189290 RepID=A0A915NTC2_9BILA
MQEKNKLLESSSSQSEKLKEENKNIFEEKVDDIKGKNKMMETEGENELIIEIQVAGIWNGEKYGIDVYNRKMRIDKLLIVCKNWENNKNKATSLSTNLTINERKRNNEEAENKNEENEKRKKVE